MKSLHSASVSSPISMQATIFKAVPASNGMQRPRFQSWLHQVRCRGFLTSGSTLTALMCHTRSFKAIYGVPCRSACYSSEAHPQVQSMDCQSFIQSTDSRLFRPTTDAGSNPIRQFSCPPTYIQGTKYKVFSVRAGCGHLES